MRDSVISTAYILGAYLFLMGASGVGGLLAAKVRAQRNRGPGQWWVSLSVRIDDDEEHIRPSIQIRGSPLPRRTKIGLRLVAADGTTRVAMSRRVPRRALDTELPLPAFAVPRGTSLDEVLGCRWDIAMVAGRRRLASWNHRLMSVAALNPEAEIDWLGFGKERFAAVYKT